MSMRSSILERTMAGVWLKQVFKIFQRGIVALQIIAITWFWLPGSSRAFLDSSDWISNSPSNSRIGIGSLGILLLQCCCIAYIVHMRVCLLLNMDSKIANCVAQMYTNVTNPYKSSASDRIVQILSRLWGWWSKVHPDHSVQNGLGSALRNPREKLHKSQDSQGFV